MYVSKIYLRRKIDMQKWEVLEEKAHEYLVDNFGDQYGLNIEYSGSSNSFEKDLNIYKNHNFLFSMDVKSRSAQSSQFVVSFDNDTKTFSFGKRNRSSENKYSRNIIRFLNTNHFFSK